MKGARASAGRLAFLLLASCARPADAPRASVQPANGAEPPSSGALWSYQVAAGANDLDVVARFTAGSGPDLAVDDEASSYVEGVEVEAPSGWQHVEGRSGVWTIAACAAGCSVRYRFHLAEASQNVRDVDVAAPFRGGFESPPSAWLLRPTATRGPTRYRFHVTTTGENHFATGVHRIPGAPDTYGAAADDLDSAPYSAFGKMRLHTITLKDATIDLATIPGALSLSDDAIDRWVRLSARAIEAYYGRFPVDRVLILMEPMRHGGGTAEGRTLASGGSSIALSVSSSMTEADVSRDWVLTHEMTHLAFPDQRREYHWIEEGLATYVEPIARARVGTIPATEVWRGLIDGLPNGEPEAGDEGLDRTHTWGRTYWGGALFCFVADVEIRKRTGGAKSLEDALRGILAAGGSGETRWPIEEALRRGDAAVGIPVLEELHAQWGTAPVTVDLEKLWRDLGVKSAGEALTFDDGAPLAGIRRAIAGGASKP